MTVRKMREELEILELQGHSKDEVVIAMDNNIFPILTVGIKVIYTGVAFNHGQIIIRGKEQIVRKRGEEMRKVARAVIDIVGALSLIGMVLLAVIATQTGYGQYRIGDR